MEMRKRSPMSAGGYRSSLRRYSFELRRVAQVERGWAPSAAGALAAPWQLPQCVCREEGGERRGDAQGEECPDEEEGLGGLADLAAEDAVGSLHVDDRDDQAKERPGENDDVSRPSFGEHQRSVQPDDENEHRKQIPEPWRRHLEEDIVRQVKRHENYGKEGRDRQHDALFHVRLAFL